MLRPYVVADFGKKHYAHMCVLWGRDLVVLSDVASGGLDLYRTSGLFVKSIGSKGKFRGQFDFRRGGLCAGPDGDSVLVAEYRNSRVQQVSVVASPPREWMRYVGMGVLALPEHVACDARHIAVSDYNMTSTSIVVFRYNDGEPVAFVGMPHNVPLQFSMIRGGPELVVAQGDVVTIVCFADKQRRVHTRNVLTTYGHHFSLDAGCIAEFGDRIVYGCNMGMFAVGRWGGSPKRIADSHDCRALCSSDGQALAVLCAGHTVHIWLATFLRTAWLCLVATTET